MMSVKSDKIDPKLLEILVCPRSKKPLIYQSKKNELWSLDAGVAFVIKKGLPVMLLEEARPLTEKERATASK